MNKVLLCLAFLTISFAALSQKVYFIYFQSDNGQPFYIKMNDRVQSSTASGYLILSKLKDSVYSFSLGFPGNKWPEQAFTIGINRKDYGFVIKNFGEKGWGLFDLQHLAVRMPAKVSATNEVPVKTENKDASDFTDILSKAADDPSLKEKPVQPAVEEKKADPAVQDMAKKEQLAVEKTGITEKVKATEAEQVPKIPEAPGQKTRDSVTLKKEEPVAVMKAPAEKPKEEVARKEEPVTVTKAPEEKPKEQIARKEEPVTVIKTPEEKPTEEVVKEEPPVEKPADINQPQTYKKSVVTKRSESSTTEGFGLTFIDMVEVGVTDTIKLIIPNQKQPLVQPVEKTEPKEEKKFLEVAPVDTVKTSALKEVAAVKEEERAIVKNDCPSVADENDFLRIRKKMAAETSDDDMVSEARKYFKTKCFSVVQVKNLGLLFLNDEGKYKFFDMAYPYVSDATNFPSLQTELKDAYYINRFRAMLRL